MAYLFILNSADWEEKTLLIWEATLTQNNIILFQLDYEALST